MINELLSRLAYTRHNRRFIKSGLSIKKNVTRPFDSKNYETRVLYYYKRKKKKWRVIDF